MYVIIWEFRARHGSENEFASAYASNGVWSSLFGRSAGYLGTELLCDASDPSRFVTVDRWTSRDACDSFRSAFADDYAAVDAACEALTVEERLVGRFDVQ